MDTEQKVKLERIRNHILSSRGVSYEVSIVISELVDVLLEEPKLTATELIFAKLESQQKVLEHMVEETKKLINNYV